VNNTREDLLQFDQVTCPNFGGYAKADFSMLRREGLLDIPTEYILRKLHKAMKPGNYQHVYIPCLDCSAIPECEDVTGLVIGMSTCYIVAWGKHSIVYFKYSERSALLSRAIEAYKHNKLLTLDELLVDYTCEIQTAKAFRALYYSGTEGFNAKPW